MKGRNSWHVKHTHPPTYTQVVPSASALLIKCLKEPVRDRKKVKNIKHDGDITLDELIDVARKMKPRSMARKLEGCVKEVREAAHDLCDSREHAWQNTPPFTI